jgi:hypothetical protein
VLYEVKSSNPPKQLRVEVNRPHGFADWQILQIKEELKSQAPNAVFDNLIF